MSANMMMWQLQTLSWGRRQHPPEPPDFSVYAGIICVLGLSVYILVKEFWQ